jgi:uncharacterized membrane protein YfcA
MSDKYLLAIIAVSAIFLIVSIVAYQFIQEDLAIILAGICLIASLTYYVYDHNKKLKKRNKIK